VAGILHCLGASSALTGQKMTFVSQWFRGSSGKKAAQEAQRAVPRASADRDIGVTYVAGEGAQVYSLDAWRRLKKLPSASSHANGAA
jgi:hypothetical protein